MIRVELKDANVIDMPGQFYRKSVMSNKWMFYLMGMKVWLIKIRLL